MNALSQGFGRKPNPAVETGLPAEDVLSDELVLKKRKVPIDVQVTLTQEQWQGAEKSDPLHMICHGRLQRDSAEACWKLSYMETAATGMEGTRTEICFFDDQSLRLSRIGEVRMQLQFRQGGRFVSSMDTPFGSMNFSMITNSVEGKLSVKGGNIDLAYSLNMGSRETYNTRLHLLVEPLGQTLRKPGKEKLS